VFGWVFASSCPRSMYQPDPKHKYTVYNSHICLKSEEACSKTAQPCEGTALSRGPLYPAFHSLECLLHFLQTTLCLLQYASSTNWVASLVLINCMKQRQGNKDASIYKTNQKASQNANGSLILYLQRGISGGGRGAAPCATESKGRQNEDFKWKTSFSALNKF